MIFCLRRKKYTTTWSNKKVLTNTLCKSCSILNVILVKLPPPKHTDFEKLHNAYKSIYKKNPNYFLIKFTVKVFSFCPETKK